MRLFDINNQPVKVDVRQSKYPLKAQSKSILQKRVGEILTDIYPRDSILEEFTVPGSRLSVDFFLPKRNIVVEVQGRQHKEHVSFFHGDRELSTKYARQKSNDRIKSHWCDLNNFQMIEIEHGSTDEEIKKAIVG